MATPTTLQCFLCQGQVIYKNKDTTRFHNHLANEHGVVFEMEFILAACRLQLVEREKFRDLMEISLDRQQKVLETEKKKKEGGRFNLDNSVAEKTWQEMDLVLGNVNQPSVKSESAVNEIKEEEIKVEIKTEIDSEENFECGKCGKPLPSRISQKLF